MTPSSVRCAPASGRDLPRVFGDITVMTTLGTMVSMPYGHPGFTVRSDGFAVTAVHTWGGQAMHTRGMAKGRADRRHRMRAAGAG
jgi:hypothetical protein